MTRPESPAGDRPFPGAHSAVPGAHTLGAASAASSAGNRGVLPLGAVPTFTDQGWAIGLVVRAEQVTVRKNVVVYERVVIRRRVVDDVASVGDKVRREELRTSIEGDIEVDTQVERTPPR